MESRGYGKYGQLYRKYREGDDKVIIGMEISVQEIARIEQIMPAGSNSNRKDGVYIPEGSEY